ncbi:MAG TPA: hypothetical protein VGL87_14455 [Steroidobacteraceae bacterium]
MTPAVATPAVVTPVPESGEGTVPAERAAAKPSLDTEAALRQRVQTLEKGLSALQDLLDRERDQLVRVQATVLHEEKAASATDIAPKTATWQAFGWPVAAALALLVSIFGVLRAWRRRPAPRPAIPSAHINARASSETFESDPPGAVASSAERHEVKPVLVVPTVVAVPTALGAPTALAAPTVLAAPEEPRRDIRAEANAAALAAQILEGVDIESLEASYLLESSGGGLDDGRHSGDDSETATLASAAAGICADDPNAETMPVETMRIAADSEPAPSRAADLDRTIAMEAATAETTKLDYNLLDLDATAHHVQMPSQLHENVGFKERRTSLVDALKIAIEREPNRRDLRMKLLETYYAAAATNRQGFLELVRKLAGEREKAWGEEWDKIIWMGRQIASDNDLFASEAADEDDQDLANCA